jgi:hypothetical protein
MIIILFAGYLERNSFASANKNNDTSAKCFFKPSFNYPAIWYDFCVDLIPHALNEKETNSYRR